MRVIVASVVLACSVAYAGELVLPTSHLHVALDDGWTADAASDLVIAGDERISIDIAPASEDRTCAAMLDGPVTSEVSWGKASASSLDLPAAVHAIVRVDRSKPGTVQRIGCVQGATTTLTFGWVSPAGETDAQKAAAAKTIGAIATAYIAEHGCEGPRSVRGACSAPQGSASGGEPGAFPTAPAAKHHRRDRRTASAAPEAKQPDLAAQVGPPPGHELMGPTLALGYQALLATDAMETSASGGAVMLERPIRPIGKTDLGYELAGSAGIDASHTVALSARAGVGYHISSGALGLYAIGGATFDWIGAGAAMSYRLPAEPGAYVGGVARTFVTDHILLDLRASKTWRLGRVDAIDASMRVAWTPDERRAYTAEMFLRDYDGAATIMGVALGIGF